MVEDPEAVFQFGPFRFDSRERKLSRDGRSVHLTPRVADLLLAFLNRPGELISNKDLLMGVWGTTHLARPNLPFQISELRRALGNGAAGDRYIENVRGHGYRLAVSVVKVGPESGTSHSDGAGNAPDAETVGAGERSKPGHEFIAPVTIGSVPRGSLTPPIAGKSDHVETTSSPVADVQPPMAVRRFEPRKIAVVVVAFGLLGIASLVVLSRDWAEAPFPEIERVTRLTDDGLVKSLVAVEDASHLIMSTPQGQFRYRVDDKRAVREASLGGFHFLDVSHVRREAVAIKPADRGGEYALWVVPLDGVTPRRLGMARSSDEAAAWSPDGDFVAYADNGYAPGDPGWSRFDRTTLFVISRRGESFRQLRAFSGQTYSMTWAPDGRFIRTVIGARNDRGVTLTMWDVDIASGETRSVFQDANVPPNLYGAAWLFGGRDELFLGPPGASQLWARHSSESLFRHGMTVFGRLGDGTKRVPVALPSRDGTRIYAIRNDVPTLLRYDEIQRGFVKYSPDVPAFNVQFSRDGKWIVYITTADYTLWRAAADGSQARPLTQAPFQVESASISPDGRRIAIRGGSGTRRKVYLLDANGGAPQPLVPGDMEQGSPSWSVDGTQLTFGDVPETFGVATGDERVHVVDVATGKSRDLEGSERLWSSRWSPDGRFIAALTIVGQELRLFDVAKKTWRSLGVSHVGYPEWTRDSRFVWCGPEGRTHTFRRVRVPDGTVDRVVDMTEFERGHDGAGLSWDDAPLLLHEPADLYAFDLRRR